VERLEAARPTSFQLGHMKQVKKRAECVGVWEIMEKVVGG
jgi:hypothetical protein